MGEWPTNSVEAGEIALGFADLGQREARLAEQGHGLAADQIFEAQQDVATVQIPLAGREKVAAHPDVQAPRRGRPLADRDGCAEIRRQIWRRVEASLSPCARAGTHHGLAPRSSL